ncbi:C2H2-type zinc finger protein [Sporobolomyces salmoneus]|uniref:C2H2-type zinc finger protein n=1 Tax=Sporobolomyces salmoneus TaxID=183962 RepID=UPI0031736F47
MAPSSTEGSGSSKKKTKERLSTCSYCPMTFKKLEHAQRHERTHTLDRPYSCETCGKTFARQDTLHRHTRLHSRTNDEGPAGKGPKKRRASTSSATKASSSVPAPKSPDLSTSSSCSSGSSAPKPINTVSNEPSFPDVSEFTSSSAAFGLSMSLPVNPPSFPAYSEPAHSFSSSIAGNGNGTGHHRSATSTSSHFNADFPSFGNSNSIDPSVLPLHSGFGDLGTGYGSTRNQPTRRASHGGGQIGGGGGGLNSLAAAGMSRPRALTLAGLPESLGCFSLINSPASSTASLPIEEGDEDEAIDSDSDDDEYRDSGMEDDTTLDKAEQEDPTWTVDSPSFPPAPESHYPSPAFSSYSPSALHTDTLTDLQAILDNDPIPSNAFNKAHQRKLSQASIQQPPQLATVPEPDFDFEAFAASIEGRAGGETTSDMNLAPACYDHMLNTSQNKNSTGGGGGLFDRYPTPPTDPMTTLPLPTTNTTTETNEFEWLNTYSATAEAQQQAREDAAATAAMFSRGFGLDPSQTSSSAACHISSALGLSLGLPSPPLTAMAMHAHSLATSNSNSNSTATTTNVSSSPHLSFPMSTPNTFTNLHATYAPTYPTFSLPSASIVPSPIQSAPASHPSISIPSGSPQTTKNSPSLHDLLAAAWERRQNVQSSPSNPSPPAVQPPVAMNLQQTPAFYIPSALHSSASQIGTATNVDSLAGLVKASGPLSLPIPTWASVVPDQ